MSKNLLPSKYLQVRGAREHNLKNVNLDLPKNKLIVITGLSDQEKVLLLLIQFMQKVKEDMLNLYLLMLAIFTNDA